MSLIATDMPNGVPVFDAAQFDGPGDIVAALGLCDIPLPCWIRVGNDSFRITSDSWEAVQRGIRLALAMQEER